MNPSAGGAPATWKLTEAKYGELPFVLLSNGYYPFDEWKQPGSRVLPELRELWKGTAVIYQLFTFHEVTAATWGEAFAERILGLQVRQLNGIEPGLGDQHEAGIRKIAGLASHSLRFREADGQEHDVPLPWRIALDFLGTSPDSPYRTAQDPAGPGLPAFPDQVDTALAVDLEYVASKATEHFRALVQTVSFVAGDPHA